MFILLNNTFLTVLIVGIPLKLAIILPACTFYGIYVYQRDRGLRLAFLERLTLQRVLNSKKNALVILNAKSEQVEYLSDAARQLFINGDDECITDESGRVRREIGRKIVDRLREAFRGDRGQMGSSGGPKMLEIYDRIGGRTLDKASVIVEVREQT